MSINGSTLYEKIKDLVPTAPNVITPNVLDNICRDETLQSFLKWFHVNVNHNNVLSNECIQMKKHIQNNDTWLTGIELDLALAEATKDCPELLKSIESDYWHNNQSQSDYTAEKDLYDLSVDHLQSVEKSLKKLKECEEQIDNDIDAEVDAVEEEEIKMKFMYESCVTVLEDFDACHRQFSSAIELLANTYNNAIQKKGEPCIWTQMPIELYIKQLGTYNDYLNAYAKRQFSKNIDSNKTNNNSFSSEIGENDISQELLCCQKNLLTSKLNEIIGKAVKDASDGVLNYAIEIYNGGNPKVPSTSVLARAEIAELTKSRDFLEENINLLQERHLAEVVYQFSKCKVTEILEKEAEARLERRKNRLLRLERLSTLAKEHGHAFSTLLCMLFELQIHRINEIVQFVIDARHYLSMEYSSSSVRSESMQKLQSEYDTIMSSPKNQNSFCQMFIEMSSLNESRTDLQMSVDHYDELRKDNEDKLKILLDEKLGEMIENTIKIEKNVLERFNKEISGSPTLSFTAVPSYIQNEIDKSVKQIQDLESNVESIRNKLKTMIRETCKPSLERESLLLWQKFLADPESLKERCEELEKYKNHISFGHASFN